MHDTFDIVLAVALTCLVGLLACVITWTNTDDNRRLALVEMERQWREAAIEHGAAHWELHQASATNVTPEFHWN